ncbi:MAG TPA: ABC transporter substrate-binding protein [Acidimicrobiales bacterium]|nr:ABC transporter substrate-binding protein [Acidimicrobiales bacterium]
MAPAVAASLSIGVAVVGLTAGSASAGGVPGVTATSITIGATVPLTGIASTGYNEVAKAADAVFKYVNSKGGVNGRHINYIIKDDCYDVQGFGCSNGNQTTVQQTNALLAVPVFATVGSLGTPTQESVRNLLKAHHTPQLFVNSGSSAWNSAAKYPTLFGWQQSYIVESKILGTYINAHLKGKKVCFLGQSDDFGKGGAAGLAQVHVHPAITQYYSVNSLVLGGAGYFTPFISAEKAASCTVVVLYTIPGATAAALGNAAALSYHPQFVISSVGSDPITLKKESSAVSDVGAITFAELPASTDTNAWNAWDRKVLLADPAEFPGFTSTTPIDGNMAYGIGWGVSFVEALRAEGKTVTQAGFVATLLKTAFQTPGLTPLRYTKGNHQGLLGGYVDTVTSDTSTTAVAGKTVYVSTDSSKVKVTVTHRLSTSVPSWLK